MFAAAAADRNTSLAIDRIAHCIRLVRRLDAAPAEIFEAWTQPEQVSCWWDPAGLKLAVCAIDLRPGGAFTFVAQGRPDMPFAGIYRDIVPVERLTFEAMGALGRVLIAEDGASTRLTVEIQCRSAEHLDQFLQMGVDQGTAHTLDNLAAYISAQAR